MFNYIISLRTNRILVSVTRSFPFFLISIDILFSSYILLLHIFHHRFNLSLLPRAFHPSLLHSPPPVDTRLSATICSSVFPSVSSDWEVPREKNIFKEMSFLRKFWRSLVLDGWEICGNYTFKEIVCINDVMLKNSN